MGHNLLKDAAMTADARHILVVANRACPCPEVLETVRKRAAGGHVHIVAPALNSRLRHWLSDIDEAVADARRRLALTVETLQGAGLPVTGSVGDSEPLAAIADTLAEFSADELVIATLPPGRSHWLERDLPAARRSASRCPWFMWLARSRRTTPGGLTTHGPPTSCSRSGPPETAQRPDSWPGASDDGVICSLGLVSLAQFREIDRATALFERLVSHANDVGVLAGDIDHRTGELLGNFRSASSPPPGNSSAPRPRPPSPHRRHESEHATTAPQVSSGDGAR
jgi:hypothetical protein